jgi:glutamyl-tRNA synthetase
MPASIADLLFPNIHETPQDVFRRYPPRELPAGAIVTRFGPSPTGFVHIGSIYISLIGRKLTRQSGGVWALRIEDTDQQREIERGVEQIVESIAEFGITPDEGVYAVEPVRERGGDGLPSLGAAERGGDGAGTSFRTSFGAVSSRPLVASERNKPDAANFERGEYGPYKQSQRKTLYAVFAKYLVATGAAYPSFQTEAELDAIRAEQERSGSQTGYYGPWAKDRQLSQAEIEQNLAQGRPFVIRYKAPYPARQTIRVQDAIRGLLEMPENDQDMVLLKSDGLPTYHLAHAVDDPLMRINLVLRGDEWLSTLPLHVQLFEALGQPLIAYAHIAPIGKMDGSSKRKLSKRKDPEAAVSYYYERGYPHQAILEYILNIANSSFEDWRKANPTAPLDDFDLRLERMSNSLALYDPHKLDSVSREVIAQYPAEKLYDLCLAWARRYDPLLADALSSDPAYSRRVLALNAAIQGQSPRPAASKDGLPSPPRKDLACWSDVRRAYGFFFDPLFAESIASGYPWPKVAADDIRAILDHCAKGLACEDPAASSGVEAPLAVPAAGEKDAWIERLRAFGESSGFTSDRKAYKQDPARFKGVFGDLMMVLRVALTNQQQTPDLYDLIQIMGRDRVERRLEEAQEKDS